MKKTTLKFFTIFQYQQEEKYLSSMHEKGWKLISVTFPGFYHFEKCEPAQAAYRLDYNQEGIQNKAEYIKFFSDCGWDYLGDMAGYSYFRKEGGDRGEEIFSDDSSRLDMMRRVFKGRIIPLVILFLCCILPNFFMNTYGYGAGGILQDILSMTFMTVAALYLVIFSVTSYQFYQYEKKVMPENPGIKMKYYGITVLILLVIICMGATVYFSKRSVYSVTERADGFMIEAEQLNESVVMEYDFKKGDRIAFRSDDYDGAELYIRIGEENKDPVFYGNSYDKMGDFTIEIEEDGRYQIECRGRRVKGIIEFSIEGKKSE